MNCTKTQIHPPTLTQSGENGIIRPPENIIDNNPPGSTSQ